MNNLEEMEQFLEKYNLPKLNHKEIENLKDKMHSPFGSVPLQSIREPERLRPEMCMKCRIHWGQCHCRAPWSLNSVDLGSTHSLGWWQTKCDSSTVSTLHTGQWYLFAVSHPSHNTTEQISLNKWLPSSPCVRVEIRH